MTETETRILTIDTYNMDNDAHIAYHDEFYSLVEKYNPETLQVMREYVKYLPLYKKEKECMKKINKNPIAKKLYDADNDRNKIWYGMQYINDLGSRHCDEHVQGTANMLKKVFRFHDRRLGTKQFQEQTTAISNALYELFNDYAEDIDTVRIRDWLVELRDSNVAFSSLMRKSFNARKVKTDIPIKEARAALNEAYDGVVSLANAHILLEGDAPYVPFVNEVNDAINRRGKQEMMILDEWNDY